MRSSCQNNGSFNIVWLKKKNRRWRCKQVAQIYKSFPLSLRYTYMLNIFWFAIAVTYLLVIFYIYFLNFILCWGFDVFPGVYIIVLKIINRWQFYSDYLFVTLKLQKCTVNSIKLHIFLRISPLNNRIRIRSAYI